MTRSAAEAAVVLERLSFARVTGVVYFTLPVPVGELSSFLAPDGLPLWTAVVYDHRTEDRFAAPVSWPARPLPDGLLGRGADGSFASWVGSLRKDDDGLLRSLRLPSRTELAAIARANTASAVIIEDVTSEEMLAVARAERVRGMILVDATIDLNP